ncbi:hypothetical protein CYY_009418 [Polysphondylium violaceum]|uniref:FAD-binding PCMH-type domain-containing protein n=1 Tax=Polysphondylium violaceum TaxID=133409 RepID=A0A8J4PK33_9MYCE|nr:hypothetical protein CYY_009418 [Polysphondylium violaceum]
MNTAECSNTINNSTINSNDDLDIIGKGDQRYNNYFQNYNSRIHREPVCYIRPTDVHQLTETLQYAQSINKGVSIRSGGHSATVYSVLDDTVNIDLSGFNQIHSFDPVCKTVVAQTGVSWKQFYTFTTAHSLAVPAGGCPSVCGGLSLAGGSNFLAPTFGYTVDSILEMTVLLANGSIVTCNDTVNQDLFWALRGAGHGGYGVVVDIKYQLYDMPPLLYFNTIELDYESSFEENLRRLVDYSKTMDTNIHLSLDVRKLYDRKSATTGGLHDPVLMKITFFYFGPPSEGETHCTALYNTLVNAKVKSLAASDCSKTFLQISLLGPDPDLIRRSYTKSRITHSSNFTTAAIADIKRVFSAFPPTSDHMTKKDPLTNFSFSMYYHGGQMNKYASDFNSYYHRHDDWAFTFIVTYLESANDALFSQWKDNVTSILDDFGPFIYQNYPDNEDPNWEYAYYGANYPRLQEIKLKYDPNNYFNYPQSIRINHNK